MSDDELQYRETDRRPRAAARPYAEWPPGVECPDPGTLRTHTFLTDLCVRCVRRITEGLDQSCNRRTGRNCDRCSSMGHPCVPVPRSFTERLRFLRRMRDEILDAGEPMPARATNAQPSGPLAELERTLDAELTAFTRWSGRQGHILATPTRQPRSPGEIGLLQLEASRRSAAAAGLSAETAVDALEARAPLAPLDPVSEEEEPEAQLQTAADDSPSAAASARRSDPSSRTLRTPGRVVAFAPPTPAATPAQPMQKADEEPELTPAQKGARTRAANKRKREEEQAAKAAKEEGTPKDKGKAAPKGRTMPSRKVKSILAAGDSGSDDSGAPIPFRAATTKGPAGGTQGARTSGAVAAPAVRVRKFNPPNAPAPAASTAPVAVVVPGRSARYYEERNLPVPPQVRRSAPTTPGFPHAQVVLNPHFTPQNPRVTAARAESVASHVSVNSVQRQQRREQIVERRLEMAEERERARARQARRDRESEELAAELAALAEQDAASRAAGFD